jgi:hypothetical protein
MRHPFCLVVVIAWILCPCARADENPKNGPVRIQGRFEGKDPRVKFQLAPEHELEIRALPYNVQLRAGKRYTITMNPGASNKALPFLKRLDPYLVVQDADGKMLAHDNASGSDGGAKLVLNVAKDGTYRVYAGTLTGAGQYTVDIVEVNTVRQGFPASKSDPNDLTKSDTAWEIDWEITSPDNIHDSKRKAPASVLAIRMAKFMFKDHTGKPRWISVLKDLEVGEILVTYDHLQPVFQDVGEHAFNIIPAKPEYLGPTCVTPGEILDSSDPRMKNRVLKEVHDDGLRWMNSWNRARRGEKMLIWAIFDGANYRYILEYGFGDDGVISCRVGATAHNFFDKQKDGRDVHLHIGCWRWDPVLCEAGAPDIGGPAHNRVLLVRRVPRTPTANGRFQVDIAPFNPDEKGQATEGFADWKAEEFTVLRVESTVRKNGSQQPHYTAYDLIPTRHGAVRNYPWKYTFANHDFWVTRSRDYHRKFSDVPAYATHSNPIDNKGCTIWHNAASLHVPRGEDYGQDGVTSGSGAAITNWTGFVLKPVNLFDSTPLYETAPKSEGNKDNQNSGQR